MIRRYCDHCGEEINVQTWVSLNVHDGTVPHPVYQLHLGCWPTFQLSKQAAV